MSLGTDVATVAKATQVILKVWAPDLKCQWTLSETCHYVKD